MCARVHVQSILFSLVFVFLSLPFCLSRDTITLHNPISDPADEKLVSANGVFELGFFTPTESSRVRRYVGIWYSDSPSTVVWVANRDKPLTNKTGIFGLADDGNLAVLTSSHQQMWSSGLEDKISSNRTVRLLDTGNLVISGVGDGESQFLWQSFDHPTDTFLPEMTWQMDSKLTSWNAFDDPKPGNFTFQVDPDNDKQYMITKPDAVDPYWKSGVYAKLQPTDVMIGLIWCLLWEPNCSQSNYSCPIIEIDGSTVPILKNLNLNHTRLVMNWTGDIKFYEWDQESGLWNLLWYQPKDTCSIFKTCGNYGSCSNEKDMPCTCLPGFEPTAPEQWKSKEFSAGCKRKSSNLCNTKEFKRLENTIAGSHDGNAIEAKTEEKCKEICLTSCNCEAYYYRETSSPYSRVNSTSTRCWTWSNGLSNILEQTEDGYNLNVRTASADIEEEPLPPRRSSNKMPFSYLILIVPAAIAIPILIVSLFYYRRRRPANENAVGIQGNPVFRFHESEQRIKEWISSSQFQEEDKKGIDVPFFDLEIILAATDNFSNANKLGQGGFGPIYKGTFPRGQEITIKRLLSTSGQGLEEFKNEVMLIAKLQHRNLVRLMGYCVEGEEKILLYEYMPNGSLDSFIFDRTRCLLLMWELRFEIVLGIARGMLYLHQDSRLRIIHRDMKSSNVLLDEEMNPKISDFGLARIFESKQTEATTKRVIGTYGYMSPEYALDGFFSFKSDVFSYGVVVLEIISGKRNTAFYQSIGTLNLISYAWKFWSENNALNLMDHALRESCDTSEVLKCINVALLCVQEDPIDRPTMSKVLYMLGSESATLPTPKKPGFAVNRSYSTTTSSSKAETIYEMSTTIVQGR